jgi:hypothetical protein
MAGDIACQQLDLARTGKLAAAGAQPFIVQVTKDKRPAGSLHQARSRLAHS